MSLDLDLVNVSYFFSFQPIDRIYRIHKYGRDAKLRQKHSWNVDDSISTFCLFATLDYYVECVLLISLLSTRSA